MGGMESHSGIGKSTRGTGKNQHVELKEKSGRLARIFRATKLFREDVSLILMKKVIGVELEFEGSNKK